MERTIAGVVKATMSLGVDIATEFPVLLLQNVVVILFLFVGGVGLVALRAAFLFSLPFIAAHSGLVALLVNALIMVTELAVDAFAIVWDGFASVIDVVAAIAGDDLDVPQIDVVFKNPLDDS